MEGWQLKPTPIQNRKAQQSSFFSDSRSVRVKPDYPSKKWPRQFQYPIYKICPKFYCNLNQWIHVSIVNKICSLSNIPVQADIMNNVEYDLL